MPTPKLVQIWPKEFQFRDVQHTTTPDRDVEDIDIDVIHHSACCGGTVVWGNLLQILTSFSNDHRDRIWARLNGYWNYIVYHDVVDYEWNIIRCRPYTDRWYHAWVLDVNKRSIWRCYIGNWDSVEPNQEQYKALAKLHLESKETLPNILLTMHRDHKATNCPWVLFDLVQLKQYINEPQVIQSPWYYKNIFNEENHTQDPNLIDYINDMVNRLHATSWQDVEHVEELVYAFLIWPERLLKHINTHGGSFG